MKITAGEIARAVGGTVVLGDPGIYVTGIATDSNKTVKGDLFVPVIGRRVDGHRFIGGAIGNGAAAVFTSEDLPDELLMEHGGVGTGTPVTSDACTARELHMEPGGVGTGILVPVAGTGGIESAGAGGQGGIPAVIRVRDTIAALQDFAGYYRDKYVRIPYIGVTGSVGKTTTREMTACALSAALACYSTKGNANSQTGVPITVAATPEDAQVGVIEMGISEFGEMERLSRVVRCDAAIVTVIDISHIAQLKSRENIMREKLHIAEDMPDGGVLIVNADDDLLGSLTLDKLHGLGIACGKRLEIRGFGTSGSAYYRAGNIRETADGGMRFTVTMPGKKDVPNPGKDDASMPGKKDVPRFGKGDASMPGKKDVSNPGKDDASMPGKADASISGKVDASMPGEADADRMRCIEVTLSVPGRHMVMNALSALAAADVLGVDPEAAVRKLGGFKNLEGRGREVTVGDIRIINDAYNASPLSMKAGLRVLGRTPTGPGGRRIAVLADMKELGVDEVRYHRETGEFIARETDIDMVLAYGELAAELIAGMKEARSEAEDTGSAAGRIGTGTGGVLAEAGDIGTGAGRSGSEAVGIGSEAEGTGSTAGNTVPEAEYTRSSVGNTVPEAGDVVPEAGGTDADCVMAADGAAVKASGDVSQCGCGIYFHKYEELYEYLRGAVRRGDVLLFKASNSMKLWRMAAELALSIGERN